jgi:hypothetical protein
MAYLIDMAMGKYFIVFETVKYASNQPIYIDGKIQFWPP